MALPRESTDRFADAINARAQLAQPPELLTALRTGLAAAGARGYWSALRDQELENAKKGEASVRTLSGAFARLGRTTKPSTGSNVRFANGRGGSFTSM